MRDILVGLGYYLHVDDMGNYWDTSGERWIMEEQLREYANCIVLNDVTKNILDTLGIK